MSRTLPPRGARAPRPLCFLRPLLAALALALIAACGGDAADSQADKRPDLVLVVVDTLRADHLSTYGYPRPTAPGLDRLGQAGVVFLDSTAQSSWTLPSMASLLIGRHVFVNAQRLPDGVSSLAERLRDDGYETAAFIGNPAISAKGGYDRGFTDFIGRETTGNVTWGAADLQAAVDRWLLAHPRTGKPRFLYLHFMDPHFPYEPKDPPAVSGEVVLRDDTLAAWVPVVKAAAPGSLLRDTFNADRLAILKMIDAYDHEIATMDRSLAAILARLGVPPAAAGAPAPGGATASASGTGAAGAGAPGAHAPAGGRETLVIVTADHGEGLWDHQHYAKVVEAKVAPEARTLKEIFFRDHSYHLFQELLHTPLVVVGPGFPAGLRVETPVENVDIAPTLLRAAGLPPDPQLTGRALQDVVAGTARPRPVLYSFANEGTVVRLADGGWKFIFPTPTGDSYGMPMQLYALPRDEHERRNLAAEPAHMEPKHLEVLQKLIKLRADAAAAFHLYDAETTHSTDPEQERVLRELGYIGNTAPPAPPAKDPATGDDPDDPEAHDGR